MRRLLLLIPTVFAWGALAHVNCTIHLIGDEITAPQTEFVRQLIQGALPSVRDLTLVRLTDLGAGVRSLGYTRETLAPFEGLVARALQSPAVRTADPESSLGRAARRLALAAGNVRALTVGLLHTRVTNEMQMLFASRGAHVAVANRGASGQNTLTDMILKTIPDAPSPHGLLLMEPIQFRGPQAVSQLTRDLLVAMASYEVSLTLHEWALAQRESLRARRATGLAGYLNLDRYGTVLIDGALAHVLLYAQMTQARSALAGDPAKIAELHRGLVKTIASHPSASKLARRLTIDRSASEAIEWSERTMARIHDDLALSSATP